MESNYRIIRVNNVYFIYAPVPEDFLGDIKPPWSVFYGDATITSGDDDGTYFIVNLYSYRVNGDNLRTDARAGLEYIWDKLQEKGLVTEPMPEPVDGNPLDMLHVPVRV